MFGGTGPHSRNNWLTIRFTVGDSNASFRTVILQSSTLYAAFVFMFFSEVVSQRGTLVQAEPRVDGTEEMAF